MLNLVVRYHEYWAELVIEADRKYGNLFPQMPAGSRETSQANLNEQKC